ncbi:solute carrier family 23 member 1-like [Argopecten irradians]|uniref:solute carrier family 23 member 1-like n=1 Tax=Argopecten irradians TaxID=31199 RepID=UPI00372467DE
MVEKGHQIDPSKSDPKNEEKLLKEQTEVVIESEAIPTLLYKVTDSVPIRLAIFFAFQQALIALSTSLAVSSFVADLACASEFPDIKRDLLSTTLLMNGVTTLMMVTIGARLPLYQGATADYVVPLLAMRNANPDACKLQEELNTLGVSTNVSTNIEDIGISFYQNTTNLSLKEKKREQALSKLQEGAPPKVPSTIASISKEMC